MADPVSGQITTAGLAPYAADYVADLFGKAAAVGETPYVPYTGDRVAQFSDLQNTAATAAAGLGASSYLSDAATLAQHFGDAAKTASYTPGTITSQTVSATPLGRAPSISAQQGTAATLGAAPTATAATLGAAPTAKAASFQGPANVTAPALQQYKMDAAQSGYDPAAGLQQYQMGPAERVGTDRFIDQNYAGQYMSPYIQNVLDIQRREALRSDDIARQERGARAAKAGAFGGARQAIEEAEANRNLQTRMNDIEATGLQRAYEAAQQQFTSDQARALQAGTANQGAGLTVGQQNLAAQLGVQGLGAQLGTNIQLQNLANQQGANQANLQAQLGTQQLGVGAQMQANLANQQMGYNTAAQNAQLQQQMALANQALAGQYGITGAQLQQQTNLANQQLAGQYGLTGAQLQNQMALQNAQLGTQAGIAQGQLQGQYDITGAQQNLQAQQMNQNANLQQQQLQQQANQFGANYGLQQAGVGMQAANTLGNIGAQEFNQNLGAINAQNTIGGQQQQVAQNLLNQQYQDFLTQQQYPQQQLMFQKNIMSGFPMGSSSTNYQYQDPSLLSQIAGGLGTAYMANKVFGSASGGLVPKARSAGLADLIISKLG